MTILCGPEHRDTRREARRWPERLAPVDDGVMQLVGVVIPVSPPTRDDRRSLHCTAIVERVDAKTWAKIPVDALLRGLTD